MKFPKKHRRRGIPLCLSLLIMASSAPLLGESRAVAGTDSFTPSSSGVRVVEFGFPNGAKGNNAVVHGPDGRIWTVFGGSDQVGAINRDGTGRTTYPVPTPGASPTGLAVGPDGNLWFTERTADKIGRVTTAGAVTEFSLPNANSEPYKITSGPDGNLWFTEATGNRIGRTSTDGTLVEFAIPTPNAGASDITSGPDGNVWFTMGGADKIGRITPAGVITEYTVPSAGAKPNGITSGPDGNLWFTEFGRGHVGRFTPGPDTFDEFPVGSGIGSGPVPITIADDKVYVGFQGDNGFQVLNLSGAVLETHQLSYSSVPAGLQVVGRELWVAQAANDRLTRVEWKQGPFSEVNLPAQTDPLKMAIGPDGDMWFTARQHIGRISSSGQNTLFPIPTANPDPIGITQGADGNLWFTENGPDKIGRITTAGVVTEFDLPPGSNPEGITTGSDANLWVTAGDDKILKMSTSGTVMDTFTTPTPNSDPDRIILGPDGRLWFTMPPVNKIGAITTSGTITEYTVPPGTEPAGLTNGSDGAIWFAGFNNSTVGRITTTGTVTTFPVGSFDNALVFGLDDRLWVSYFDAGKVGFMAGGGVMTDYFYQQGVFNDVAVGPDGAIWLSWRTSTDSRIVRIDPATVGALPIAQPATAVAARPAFTG